MKGQSIAVNVVTMTSLELAEMCGQRHDNFCAKVPKVLGEAAPKFLGVETFTNGTGGQVQRKIYRFPRREACLMAMSYSYELQAKVFDRMTELEQAQVAAPANLSDTMQAAVILLESAKRNLNLSNSSMLGGYQKLQAMAGLPDLMPVYAIDAPADAVDGSSRSTSALRTLLQQRNFPVKVQYAYQRLQELGIVQRMTRPSTKGEKQFWSITASGLMFGKNMTSPGNPRETQPHFFDSRADELLQLIVGGEK